MKITSYFGIYKAIYHNGSFLFLFGKRKSQMFEILCEWFLLLWNKRLLLLSTTFQQAPHPTASKLNKRWGCLLKKIRHLCYFIVQVDFCFCFKFEILINIHFVNIYKINCTFSPNYNKNTPRIKLNKY